MQCKKKSTLLGVEQAWTPIFNLTDLLCKSLALQKNLSTYFDHQNIFLSLCRCISVSLYLCIFLFSVYMYICFFISAVYVLVYWNTVNLCISVSVICYLYIYRYICISVSLYRCINVYFLYIYIFVYIYSKYFPLHNHIFTIQLVSESHIFDATLKSDYNFDVNDHCWCFLLQPVLPK